MKGTYKTITDIEQIQELRNLIGWDPLPKKLWKQILDNSSQVYSVWDKSRLLGMGRAVADGRYCMLYDVIVHKDYHNRGIGKMIINGLVKKAKTGTRIGLFVENKKSLINFYRSQGFYAIRGMQMIKK